MLFYVGVISKVYIYIYIYINVNCILSLWYICIGSPVITTSTQKYTCVAGQSLTLSCSVSADPGVDHVFWQVVDSRGEYVTLDLDGDQYKGSSVDSPSLTIQKAHTSDSGTYRCCATNDVGTSQSLTILLQVLGSMC